MKIPQAKIINTPANYLTGFADAKLKEAETLDTVCSSIIPNYNVERFEAVAIRLYLGKETGITVYALDKQSNNHSTGAKLPTKKFKVQISLEEIIARFSNINLTISTGNYDLEDMEIINK